MRAHPFEIEGEKLILLAHKAIFWPSRKALLLADLHLGKVQHFRKAGIGVPEQADQNLVRLEVLFQEYPPREVYFLGDLFHSVWNQALSPFAQWLQKRPEVRFHLIQGNHDILPTRKLLEMGLHLHTLPLDLGPFRMSHEPISNREDRYNLAGHIHPGVLLRGAARQRLTLPCFYFGARGGLLPAFGSFTGLSRIKVKSGDRVFALSGDEIWPPQPA